MTETPFTGVEGSFVSMPPRNVVPKPVQKPHPPLWVACSRRDTILLAAEKGIGALSFAFIEPEERRAVGAGLRGDAPATKCVPVGLAVNPQVACVTPMMCAGDEEAAIARGLEGANFFGYSLAHFYVFGEHVPGRDQRVGGVRAATGKDGVLTRGGPGCSDQRRSGAKAAAGDQTGLRGAVGYAGPAPRVPPPVRGRPASTS